MLCQRFARPSVLRWSIANPRPATSRVLSPSNARQYAEAHLPRSQSSPPRRGRATFAIGTIALLLGLVAGNFIVHTIAPPPLPEAGTHGDSVLMADLHQRIDGEFKVQVLRGKCLGVAKMLKGEESGWVEVVPPAGNGTRDDHTSIEKNLISTLAGARGLGVERLFWNRGEHKLVAVIWFGGGICGWPGMTHGGAIATELCEKLALAESLAQQTSNDVTEAAIPQRLPGSGDHAKMFAPSNPADEPAQFSLSYVKPTYANQFYVIRVSPVLAMAQDPEHIVPSEPVGGHEYEATLETMEAKICVKAKAKFEPSSTTSRALQNVERKTKSTYESFTQWMWPSRQRSTT